MALALDGFAILRSIGTNPDAFPDIAAEVEKTAVTLVTKQLKISAVDIASLRRVYNTLGIEGFRQFVGHMKGSQLDTLVKKLDKHHPDLKTASATWKYKHLLAIADGTIEPAPDYKAVRKKLTAKSVSLPNVREIAAFFEKERLQSILDGLSDTQVRTLVKRIDKHHPQLKTASTSSLRDHLQALALGAEPSGASGAEGSPWSQAIDASFKRR